MPEVDCNPPHMMLLHWQENPKGEVFGDGVDAAADDMYKESMCHCDTAGIAIVSLSKPSPRFGPGSADNGLAESHP